MGRLWKLLVEVYSPLPPKKKWKEESGIIYWCYRNSSAGGAQIASLHIRIAAATFPEVCNRAMISAELSEHLCYTAYLFQLHRAGILFIGYYLATSIAIQMFQNTERSKLGQMK